MTETLFHSYDRGSASLQLMDKQSTLLSPCIPSSPTSGNSSQCHLSLSNPDRRQESLTLHTPIEKRMLNCLRRRLSDASANTVETAAMIGRPFFERQALASTSITQYTAASMPGTHLGTAQQSCPEHYLYWRSISDNPMYKFHAK